MKGAVGFLVGLIGLCLFMALAGIIPFAMRRSEGLAILLFVVVVAFVFLNIMMVGFFRLLGGLHETVLYPDDPYHYPHRGRGLFLTGYIGLLVTLSSVFLLAVLPELLRRGFGREAEALLVLAWVAGWAFMGCLLGGVLTMLSDLYHKAFYRTTVNPPSGPRDDDLNIARGAAPRREPAPRRTWDTD
jgi:hypothetical protein